MKILCIQNRRIPVHQALQEDVPEKMADTRQLWEMFKAEKYDKTGKK